MELPVFILKRRYSLTGPEEKDCYLPILMHLQEQCVKIKALYLEVRMERLNFRRM